MFTRDTVEIHRAILSQEDYEEMVSKGTLGYWVDSTFDSTRPVWFEPRVDFPDGPLSGVQVVVACQINGFNQPKLKEVL